MTIAAKTLGARMPGGEVAFVRFVGGALLLLPLLLWGRPRWRVAEWPPVLLRGIAGGLAVILYFEAIARIPVSQAVLLNNIYPVFTAMFSAIFLGERIRAAGWLAFPLVLGGAALTMGVGGDWSPSMGVVMGFASSIFSGSAVTALKWARRTEGPLAILMVFNLIGGVCCLLTNPLSWQVPDLRESMLLWIIAAAAMAGQLGMSYVVRFITAAQMGVLNQLTIVLTYIWGVMFFGEPLTVSGVTGGAMIIAGVWWLTSHESILKKADGRPGLRP
ncbi:MAG: hypothetical protein GMKNLPBB_00559 [Myxococcota bacterium]|nr:hypothetical protein [Myxococcota bacterium]